ncbi:MAG TPA: PilZ domain-containing protein [Thermoanaerobaculia bacterium]|nr:PilZ domain-containing protein [Thermoanaerobaculia bacterium]
MDSDRRRSPRMRAPEGAEGVIRSTIQAQVEDVSRTGARFQLSGPVRPGSTYTCHADLGGFDLTVPIRITRCKAGSVPKPGGTGMVLVYQAGAEFLWESPGDEERLVAWLGKRGPTSAQIQAKLKG